MHRRSRVRRGFETKRWDDDMQVKMISNGRKKDIRSRSMRASRRTNKPRTRLSERVFTIDEVTCHRRFCPQPMCVYNDVLGRSRKYNERFVFPSQNVFTMVDRSDVHLLRADHPNKFSRSVQDKIIARIFGEWCPSKQIFPLRRGWNRSNRDEYFRNGSRETLRLSSFCCC